MIVRARYKRIEDIHKRHLCCSVTQEFYTHAQTEGAFEIDTERTMLGFSKCAHCGKRAEAQATPVIGSNPLKVVLLDVIDIDEGG